jgi:phytoene synthase
MMPPAADAARVAARMTRASGTSFYYSFLLLPREKRQAIYAIYAFCRACDDVADGAGEAGAKLAALGEWRRELARCYEGAPTHPITAALLPAIRRYALPREQFEGILDGVASDVATRRYRDFTELRHYCFQVASRVGLLCVEVFGYRSPGTRCYAEELGLAFQLTNILRDLGADAALGRLYLPQEDLARHGVEEEELMQGRLTPRVRELLRFQVHRARDQYRSAERLLPAADRSSLFPARIMAGIYQGVLTEIERMEYDVFRRRAGLGAARKLGIALKIFIAEKALSPWSRGRTHERES